MVLQLSVRGSARSATPADGLRFLQLIAEVDAEQRHASAAEEMARKMLLRTEKTFLNPAPVVLTDSFVAGALRALAKLGSKNQLLHDDLCRHAQANKNSYSRAALVDMAVALTSTGK